VQEANAAADLALLDQRDGRVDLAFKAALSTGFRSRLVVTVGPPLSHQGSKVAVLPLSQPALQRTPTAAAVAGDAPQKQLPEPQQPLESAAALSSGLGGALRIQEIRREGEETPKHVT
jgi:hypothetical protein